MGKGVGAGAGAGGPAYKVEGRPVNGRGAGSAFRSGRTCPPRLSSPTVRWRSASVASSATKVCRGSFPPVPWSLPNSVRYGSAAAGQGGGGLSSPRTQLCVGWGGTCLWVVIGPDGTWPVA